jgi:membrane protease YdiL (CAAX protease family)
MGRILLGVALAIALTTGLDATGFADFSALPLIPLFALFAWLDRIPRRELGLAQGTPDGYASALGHPIVVIGALAALASAAGAMDLSAFDSASAVRNVALSTGATFLLAIVTEEGFFRGWLWAVLTRHRISALATLSLTTVAFVLWHVSFVFVSSEFHFVQSDIPLFFINATLLGLIWGMLRLASGSIIVSSAGHGLWNGLTYVLFGVGSTPGALGIRNLALYGPEVGLYGAALNALVLAVLCWLNLAKLRRSPRPAG